CVLRDCTRSGCVRAPGVVEAGERGGARHQARVAAGHGRPVILTDLVTRRCDWARALAGRPGVHVARSLVSVLDLIDQLIAESPAPPGGLHPVASREPLG